MADIPPEKEDHSDRYWKKGTIEQKDHIWDGYNKELNETYPGVAALLVYHGSQEKFSPGTDEEYTTHALVAPRPFNEMGLDELHKSYKSETKDLALRIAGSNQAKIDKFHAVDASKPRFVYLIFDHKTAMRPGVYRYHTRTGTKETITNGAYNKLMPDADLISHITTLVMKLQAEPGKMVVISNGDHHVVWCDIQINVECN